MTKDELLHNIAVVVADLDADGEPSDDAVAALEAIHLTVDGRDPGSRPALTAVSVEARLHAIIDAAG